MPVVKRSRRIEAPRERVWEVIADPYALPRWWPRLQRVEEATEDTWTKVLTSDRGKPVRADYTRVSADPPERLEWRQELAETPFERILSESRLTISLDEREGATDVTVTSRERLRGLARLGALMVRRATHRRLDEALERLALAVE
jgi:uncharacterized protein YndB with AHSA1/START domain